MLQLRNKAKETVWTQINLRLLSADPDVADPRRNEPLFASRELGSNQSRGSRAISPWVEALIRPTNQPTRTRFRWDISV